MKEGHTYRFDGIRFNYVCDNPTLHDYSCCNTCWNLHPDKRFHFGKMSTDKRLAAREVLKKELEALSTQKEKS